ncbi:MAG: TatD family hydrolase [Desulfovibrionaceae bacterium]|jgi:TatD DNase family protein|nr:TatD family hydrolase [Desulfovibrionaceae bacterium]
MSKKKKTPAPEPQSLNLPRTGVETHAHLDMEDFAADFEAVLQRGRDSGVSRFGNVFLGPDAYHAGRERFAAHPDVFFLLGIHPHDATTCDHDALARMHAAFQADANIRALGEIGLDYFYDLSPRPIQQAAFKDQLALARTLDVTVVIHSRDAFEDTLKILLDMGMHKQRLVWHCFGGDTAMAEEILSHHWIVSIPGPVTFPRSTDLQAAVAAMPADRIVIETDCPYLTPVPYRGKRNEPAYTAFTAAKVAELKNMDPAALWTQAGDTARRIFGL